MLHILLVVLGVGNSPSAASRTLQDQSASCTGTANAAEEQFYAEGGFFDDWGSPLRAGGTSLLQSVGINEGRGPGLTFIESVGITEGRGPGLTFNHLAKAGGNFAKRVLAAAVPAKDFRYEIERRPLRISDGSRFTIGVMRNPCEYYVSLYSFGAEGRGDMNKRFPSGVYKRDSPENFHKWLENITADTGDIKVGVLSYRFAESYGQADIQPMMGPLWDISSDVAHRVKDVTRAFNISKIDCWIKTENIIDDLRECLIKYKKVGGLVDWTRFHETTRVADHNSSPHMACSKFFVNDRTLSLVREADGQLFTKFGYSRCCEK